MKYIVRADVIHVLVSTTDKELAEKVFDENKVIYDHITLHEEKEITNAINEKCISGTIIKAWCKPADADQIDRLRNSILDSINKAKC